jgi:hypothetical protein
MTRPWWVLGLALLGVLGCAERPAYQLAAVSGWVTLDGRPLAGAYVTFQPRGDRDNSTPGPASVGRTDQDGRFSLTVVDPRHAEGPAAAGAVVGLHRVIIRKSAKEGSGDEGAPYQDALPARYNRDTTLEFRVPAGGTDQANFPLTSSEDPGKGKE